MVYGTGEDAKLIRKICEACGKSTPTDEIVTAYGPDEITDFENNMVKRVHWYCSVACEQRGQSEQ
jgi:hypothetical protein